MIRTVFIREFMWEEGIKDHRIIWQLPILTNIYFRPGDIVRFGERVCTVRETIYDAFNFTARVVLYPIYRKPNEMDMKSKEEGWIDEGDKIVSWKVC